VRLTKWKISSCCQDGAFYNYTLLPYCNIVCNNKDRMAAWRKLKILKNFGAITIMLINNLTPFKWKIQLKVKL